ncbi:MAG TPA: T9SS type A sorting domain-containing protein [Saprospiraceae bacterium]|nr:T9SS type A sorting domain-containing protein [Saprospiraceae bacterium]
MIFRITNTLIVWILLVSIAQSQNFDRLNIPVTSGQKTLKLPLTGGLKAGQFSNIDFNDDGIMDLFVFDRNGDQVLPFLKTGTVGSFDYVFAPEYIPIFPKMRDWCLLVDFNNDGIKDIFTSANSIGGSTEVWRGKKQNGILSFELVTFDFPVRDILQFEVSGGSAQIYVSSEDLPAVADIDGDGDIDMVTFEADGSYASYYQNVSVEKNHGLDTLIYIRKDLCWGKFSENQFNEEIKLSDDPFSCADYFLTGGNQGTRHSGSSLCLLDYDGDKDMDLLIGDLGSSRIKLLFNGGTKENAYITSFDQTFPKDDNPIFMDIFLAAYHVDADGDGDRDIIVTTNNESSGESENHIWLYKNIGSDDAPQFKFEKKNFLIDEMLNFNNGSHPAFADINGDGLQDILVGSNGIQKIFGEKENRLYLLLNTGTKDAPAYYLADEDYLEFSKYNDITGRFGPAFGDLDGDGDLDLLIGDVSGNLFYLENIGGKGNPMEFKAPIYKYFDINIGQNAKPQIVDLDGDGLLDIVIGENNNNLNFFKNTGSITSPSYLNQANVFPNTFNMGKIFGFAYQNYELQAGSPFFIKQDNKWVLLFGIRNGKILAIDDIEGNIYDGFSLIDSTWGNFNQGIRVNFSLADIDNDGYYEIAIGNERGGLAFYNTMFKLDGTSSSVDIESIATITVYPNPASNIVFISSNHSSQSYTVYNTNGIQVMKLVEGTNILNPELSNGMYIIESIRNNGQKTYNKLIISK